VTRGPSDPAGERIDPATTPTEVEEVRALFLEYATGLGVDLSFEHFDEELRSLPGPYAPPRGTLLVVHRASEPVGCAGVRPLASGECELKRLYLRPAVRGHGLGRRLLGRALDFAAAAGYATMWLDTLPSMVEAIGLYRSLGFVEVPEYRPNPIPGTRYFRRELPARAERGTSK